jgi:DNA-binding MarR family transcriptional regulator/GNAT superfamily N-acetyltransferase
MIESTPTAALRRFNRYWTRRIGVLREGLAASDFPLAESRLLWELAHRQTTSVTELARDLDLDLGYTSRLVRRFRERGLVAAQPAPEDGRRQRLRLTPKGRRAFAPLDRGSEREAAALLEALPQAAQERLVAAMATIESTLDPAPAAAPSPTSPSPFLLRPPRAGDMGWVVARHGALYAAEHGWDWRFEALVARIVADFVERFDGELEACWIAERDGRPLGSVFLVQARHDDGAQQDEPIPGVAQLRLLLLEPDARGHGLGARLVAECERFARARGYRTMVLWTNSVLHAARAIYARAGWQRVSSEPHESFGRSLVGERWELPLVDAGAPPATIPPNHEHDRGRRR